MKRIVLACLVVTASLGVAVGLTHFRDLGVAHAQGSDEVVDISGRRSVELPHPMLVYTPGPNLYDEQHAGRESIPRLDYVADGSGSGAVMLPPPPVVDAPAAGSGSATPPKSPAELLPNPVDDPLGALTQAKALKQQGWALFILGCIVMVVVGFTRAASRWPGNRLFAWVAKHKYILLVVGGVGVVASAAFNALALGGTMIGALYAAGGALLTLVVPGAAKS